MKIIGKDACLQHFLHDAVMLLLPALWVWQSLICSCQVQLWRFCAGCGVRSRLRLFGDQQEYENLN